MSLKSISLVLIFIYTVFSSVEGQVLSSDVLINGKIISSDNKEAIPFAHIIINDRNIGVSSDINGEFYLHINKFDTLSISAIGYAQKKLFVGKLIGDSILQFEIALMPKVYELSTIVVTPFLPYEKFKKAFLEYQPVGAELLLYEKELAFYENMSKPLKDINPLDYMSDRTTGIVLSGPIHALYNLFDKKKKNARKLERMKLTEELLTRVQTKFNHSVIKQLTVLEDSMQIETFIAYCNFDFDFIDQSSEIELYSEISKSFKDYMKLDLTK